MLCSCCAAIVGHYHFPWCKLEFVIRFSADQKEGFSSCSYFFWEVCQVSQSAKVLFMEYSLSCLNVNVFDVTLVPLSTWRCFQMLHPSTVSLSYIIYVNGTLGFGLIIYLRPLDFLCYVRMVHREYGLQRVESHRLRWLYMS